MSGLDKKFYYYYLDLELNGETPSPQEILNVIEQKKVEWEKISKERKTGRGVLSGKNSKKSTNPQTIEILYENIEDIRRYFNKLFRDDNTPEIHKQREETEKRVYGEFDSWIRGIAANKGNVITENNLKEAVQLIKYPEHATFERVKKRAEVKFGLKVERGIDVNEQESTKLYEDFYLYSEKAEKKSAYEDIAANLWCLIPHSRCNLYDFLKAGYETGEESYGIIDDTAFYEFPLARQKEGGVAQAEVHNHQETLRNSLYQQAKNILTVPESRSDYNKFFIAKLIKSELDKIKQGLEQKRINESAGGSVSAGTDKNVPYQLASSVINHVKDVLKLWRSEYGNEGEKGLDDLAKRIFVAYCHIEGYGYSLTPPKSQEAPKKQDQTKNTEETKKVAPRFKMGKPALASVMLLVLCLVSGIYLMHIGVLRFDFMAEDLAVANVALNADETDSKPKDDTPAAAKQETKAVPKEAAKTGAPKAKSNNAAAANSKPTTAAGAKQTNAKPAAPAKQKKTKTAANNGSTKKQQTKSKTNKAPGKKNMPIPGLNI